MDKKDSTILSLLRQNARATSSEIAKTARMPITTVHNRIKRLEKGGIIKGYTVIIDPIKVGMPLAAYILIAVDYKLLKEKKLTQYGIVKKLKQHEAVEEAAMLTGTSDIIIKIRAKDVASLNEFVTVYLRNIDGIEKTQTAIVLNEA